MPTDPRELEERVARVGRNDAVRGFNFAAVFALVEAHAGPETAVALRAPLGKRVLGFFNYPAADFLRVAFHAADLLEPHYGSVDAAFRALGEATARALVETTVGKTLITFVRANPPSQLVRYVPTAYGMAVSYGERTVTPVSPRSARLVFQNDCVPPAFHEGVLRSGLRASGLEVQVEGMGAGPSGCELLVRWG